MSKMDLVRQEMMAALKARDKDDNVVKIVRFPGVCVFEPLEETYYEGCKNVMTHTTYTLPTEQ